MYYWIHESGVLLPKCPLFGDHSVDNKKSLTLCDPGIKYIQPFSNVASSNAIQTLIACRDVNDQ